MKWFPVQTEGPLMRVTTTPRLLVMSAPLMVALGIGSAAYGRRAPLTPTIAASAYAIGALLVLTGLFFIFLRRGVDLDAESKRVTAWWRWLFFGGQQSIQATGKSLRVERARRDSGDGDYYYTFNLILGEHRLFAISDSQGGAELATKMAERMGKHLGLSFIGQRDSAKLRRLEALEAKYALFPLLVVAVLTLAGLIVMLFTDIL
jgi:Na+/H+ antiporter NhaC